MARGAFGVGRFISRADAGGFSERGVHAASTIALPATLKRAKARAPFSRADAREFFVGLHVHNLERFGVHAGDVYRRFGSSLSARVWSCAMPCAGPPPCGARR